MIQFEKSWSNLWLLRWLRPSCNLVRNFKLVGLWTLKIGFAYGQPILTAQAILNHIWGKVFKSRPSKICGRQPSKDLKGYGLLK